MELETLVRGTVPDFVDVEIDAYLEEKDGDKVEIVKVMAEHDGEMYAFEVAEGDGLPNEIHIASIQRQYRVLIEEAMKEELKSLEKEDE